MPQIQLLVDGVVQPYGLFKIVGTIRHDFEVLGESNQGEKMHGLLKDLAEERGAMKGTKIKKMKKSGLGFEPAEKWEHDGKKVMHYSTGEKLQDARTHSVTLFFYEAPDAKYGKTVTIIAAGHHIDNSKDYKIVWGVRKGDYGTV